MKHVVIINGSGGVGKDTFINECQRFARRDEMVVNISSVDMVKEAAKLLGWDGERKDEVTRKFLSDLKNLSFNYNNGPEQYILNYLWTHIWSIAFIHIREPYQIKRMIERLVVRYGKHVMVHTLLIKNENIDPISSNQSDMCVGEFDYDKTIDNSESLGQLQAEARQYIVTNIYGEKGAKQWKKTMLMLNM